MARVLVVEDDVMLRYALAHWLREGHEVLEAATADEALAILKSIVTVDIVVTDVQMPGSMNGLDLTTYIRESFPSLPVIVVSGNPIPKDYAHASASFRKPYDFHKITACIETLVVTNQSVPAAERKLTGNE
jgi:two-component system, response regulator PdtaR